LKTIRKEWAGHQQKQSNLKHSGRTSEGKRKKSLEEDWGGGSSIKKQGVALGGKRDTTNADTKSTEKAGHRKTPNAVAI